MTAGRKNITDNKEWGTPAHYVIAVKRVLGQIELDPCSNKYSLVNANVEYKLPMNGLRMSWNFQTIYVNPPYGTDVERRTKIKDWLECCTIAYKNGSQVIALIPVAPNTNHWKQFVWGSATAICFLYDTRLKFLVDGKEGGNGAPMACAMIYWGDGWKRFALIFSEFGSIVREIYIMITLRPYQEETLDRIWEYFASGKKGNPLIAMPTGTGKSCIPAVFIERIMRTYPDQRFLVMTHVAELIKQNYEVMQHAWPDAPVGIYSAGLKKKQPFYPIVFGGIQSMAKDPARFGHRDIIFVDEAHLISDEDSSQYITFLSTMKLLNPNVKIIGMTATPFRMGMGLLTEGTIFTDIIHDLTSCDEFNRLIAEGYMCPLVPKRTHTELSVEGVGMSKGDFVMSQLEHAVDVDKITFGALKEAVEYGHNRKSWLIFSSGIEHAEHIATMLGTFGIDCAAVHSKQKSEYNDAAIKAFKSNSLRAISSYSKLTTGFNHPEIDLICDLRPTMSIPLHIQKLGRGTRTANGKENCLVLDFGRNVPRLGPINDPTIPKKRVEGNGDVPVKICEACGTYNHAKVRFCTNCGNEFQFQIKYFAKAGTEAILKSDLPIIEMFDVDRVIYNRREKEGKPAHIRCTYYCGLRSFNEYLFPENVGYTKKLFHDWWKKRHTSEPPIHCDAVLNHMKELRTPKRIRVWCNKKFPEVMGVEF